jgi:hypothetical protein
MKRARGCLIVALVVIVVGLLACGILAETTTPFEAWLFQHNFYFADLVNWLHHR